MEKNEAEKQQVSGAGNVAIRATSESIEKRLLLTGY